MENLAGRWQRQRGLALALIGGLLAIAPPVYSGSVPSGANSGVTVGGSSILTIGASDLGSEAIIESRTPNALVDPQTGAVTLTAAAQQAVNQTALQILQALQSSNPTLAVALANPITIDVNAPVPAGFTLQINGVAFDEFETLEELAAAVAAAIANGDSVLLTSSQGTLSITPPSAAVYTPIGGTPLVVPLGGSAGQLANAAGFMAAAFAAGLNPSQIAPFIDIALTGADYLDLIALFNAVGGLLPPQPQPQAAGFTVNGTQLEAAIQAYNQLLDGSDADTLTALSQNANFTTLGRSLQQLRAAIDL